MTWLMRGEVATDIIHTNAMFQTMPGSTITTYGIEQDRREWLEFQQQTMGTAGVPMERQALLRAIGDRLGSRPARPGPFLTLFEDCKIEAVLAQLCAHLGVDPLMLAIAGSSTRSMHARRGEQAISLSYIPAKEGTPPEISGSVRLSRQVTWHSGKLTIARTALPYVVLTSLAGQTVERIMQHDWEGWKSIRITRASRRGGATVISTDATDDQPLIH